MRPSLLSLPPEPSSLTAPAPTLSGLSIFEIVLYSFLQYVKDLHFVESFLIGSFSVAYP